MLRVVLRALRESAAEIFIWSRERRRLKKLSLAIPNGLYVTDLIGHGVNIVTGDYSHGASGLWIENGELSYPVEEITVAGNLKEMLHNISSIGSDLIFRSVGGVSDDCD